MYWDWHYFQILILLCQYPLELFLILKFGDSKIKVVSSTKETILTKKLGRQKRQYWRKNIVSFDIIPCRDCW